MIRKHILLTEEEAPLAARWDEEFLVDLQVAEEDRLKTQALEEARAAKMRVGITDIYTGETKQIDFSPRAVRVFTDKKPPKPKEILEARECERKERLASYWKELMSKPDAEQPLWRAEPGTPPPKKRTYESRYTKCGGDEFFEDVPDAEIQVYHLKFTLENVFEYVAASKDYYAAWLWIRIPYQHAFSFRRCCLAMGADPELIQDELEAWRRKKHSPAQWIETERTMLGLEIAECSAIARTEEDWLHVAELRDRLFELDPH